MSSGQDQDKKAFLIPIEKDQRPFKCGLCSFVFDKAAQLDAHIREHSQTKPFQCGYCLASYDSGSDLARHVNTHQLFMCVAKGSANENLSPVKSPASGTVTRKPQHHQNRDSTPKPSPVAIGSNLLSGKIRAKEGQYLRRPFTCNICRLSYDFQKDFRKHCILVHRNDRPFPCALCHARFKVRSHLSDHVSAVHGFEKPFECEFCGQRFKIRNYLRMHMYKRHPEAKWGHLRTHTTESKAGERGSAQKRNDESESQPSFGKAEIPDAVTVSQERGDGVVGFDTPQDDNVGDGRHEGVEQAPPHSFLTTSLHQFQ